jgi:hypothetical protein
MHIVTGAAILFLLWQWLKTAKIKKELIELRTRIVSYTESTHTHVRNLNDVIKVQNEYINALQNARAETKEKVDELITLLPEAQDQQKQTVYYSSDAEHAAVIMYQRLEDAMRLVQKHQPEGPLYKELTELLR